MKLDIEKIKEITNGVSYIDEENGAVSFHRFTKEQEDAYSRISNDFYQKAFASSGVRFEFETDSRTLSFSGSVSRGSSRRHWEFDIFVDDKLALTFGGKLSSNEDTQDFGVTVSLADGVKKVKVLLPWSVKTLISELLLDDGAFVKPVKKSKTMLMFGDSITQGYDASKPSCSYASRVTDALCVNTINKAIGGEFFRGELAAMGDDISPDYITVAYGTNNWAKRGKAEFEDNCKAFFENLSKTYPDAKIFAITPIWRADIMRDDREYPFSYLEEYIRRVCLDIPSITVISGFDFVPRDTELFADKYLHPDNKGFEYYADSLIPKLKAYLD